MLVATSVISRYVETAATDMPHPVLHVTQVQERRITSYTAAAVLVAGDANDFAAAEWTFERPQHAHIAITAHPTCCGQHHGVRVLEVPLRRGRHTDARIRRRRAEECHQSKNVPDLPIHFSRRSVEYLTDQRSAAPPRTRKSSKLRLTLARVGVGCSAELGADAEFRLENADVPINEFRRGE